mmetsp:Transcript_36023/g.45409  ORF Transcript_36023/g.45409 Transcript_36023/m.45409 type:complete len:82 (+) Transcript_36023:695-940(+)
MYNVFPCVKLRRKRNRFQSKKFMELKQLRMQVTITAFNRNPVLASFIPVMKMDDPKVRELKKRVVVLNITLIATILVQPGP